MTTHAGSIFRSLHGVSFHETLTEAVDDGDRITSAHAENPILWAAAGFLRGTTA